ncbi:MAG: hypothetical protein Q8O79_08615, partial [Pseudomonadota bacterium]|nr:hypothetical protein [Pseudomonadota bacterium]
TLAPTNILAMQKLISSPLVSPLFAAWRAVFLLSMRQCSALGLRCFSVVPHQASQFLRSCLVVLFRVVSHYENHFNLSMPLLTNGSSRPRAGGVWSLPALCAAAA